VARPWSPEMTAALDAIVPTITFSP
jgi:hypothetical protein